MPRESTREGLKSRVRSCGSWLLDRMRVPGCGVPPPPDSRRFTSQTSASSIVSDGRYAESSERPCTATPRNGYAVGCVIARDQGRRTPRGGCWTVGRPASNSRPEEPRPIETRATSNRRLVREQRRDSRPHEDTVAWTGLLNAGSVPASRSSLTRWSSCWSARCSA